MLDYDFTASGQFVRDIDDALKQCRHLLILHTADHHDSFWSQQEFHNVLAAVADSDGQRRIGVLRCDFAMPGGLLHSATYGDLGRFERCVDALSEGSGGCLRVLGARHPNTLSSEDNVACCLQSLGQGGAALPLFRQALDGREHGWVRRTRTLSAA